MILYDICLCLTSLNMIISRSIHVDANGIISFFFYGKLIFHHMYILYLLFCCCFSGLCDLNSPIGESYGNSVFSFFKEPA